MKIFEINGEFERKGEKQKFKKELKAESEKLAIENTYCLIGGKQKIPRRKITIIEVKEVK